MTERSRVLEMGNLVCRFGKKHVLLDLANEVVLPSFFDTAFKRKYDKTKYFFHDTRLVVLDANEPVLGIAGRFVKDTLLEREQYYASDSHKLIADDIAIPSAPSAIFLFVLNNHRLIYVKETKYAPSMNAFRSTLHNFLKLKTKQHVQSLYESSLEDESIPHTTKTDLNKKFPSPTLTLIPLTTQDDVDQFIRNYDVLNSLVISFAERNDENDSDPFFESFQKKKEKLGSTKSTIRHSSAEGLDKEEVIKEVAEATQQGTQLVKLAGKDSEGDDLRGNNENFQLKKPISQLGKTIPKAAKKLYSSYLSLVDDGIISVPETSEEALQKIKSILNNLKQ